MYTQFEDFFFLNNFKKGQDVFKIKKERFIFFEIII